MSQERHPGINMHKLPVGGGFIGILFAVGSAAIFILGFPTLWYFVALSTALGIAIAFLMRFFYQRKTEGSKPLSILNSENENNPLPAHQYAKKNGNLIHAVPRTVTI